MHQLPSYLLLTVDIDFDSCRNNNDNAAGDEDDTSMVFGITLRNQQEPLNRHSS